MSIRNYECQTEADFYQETPFDHAPENKDLITDILQYLKDNEEARGRFNKGYYKKIYKSAGIFGNKSTFENESVFYGWTGIDELKKDKGYLALHIVELQYFLIHALSSPNKKPICRFLEEKEEVAKLEIGGYESDIIIYNDAETLLNTFIKHMSNGEGFEESYKEVNKIYNKYYNNKLSL